MTGQDSTAANDQSKTAGVGTSLVEAIEAPRLTGITTAEFVAFKEARDLYERRVAEKSSITGIDVPMTA